MEHKQIENVTNKMCIKTTIKKSIARLTQLNKLIA